MRNSKLLYSALVKGIEQSSDVCKDFHLARLQSVTAEGSHRWLTVTPSRSMLRLPDDEYRWMAWYRLGVEIPGIRDLPKCPCCYKPDAFLYDPWHYLNCNTLISVWGTARHNSATLNLMLKSLTAGCHARHEPSHLSNSDSKRPDLELFTIPEITLIDTVISNPVAPSHIRSARREALAVAQEAVKCKEKKYKDMAEYQNAKFLAFACETFGGISKSAKKVVELIADITVTNCPWVTRRETIECLLNENSVIIQRGNAAIVRAGELQRSIASRFI